MIPMMNINTDNIAPMADRMITGSMFGELLPWYSRHSPLHMSEDIHCVGSSCN